VTLTPDLGTNLSAEVEIALAARGAQQRPGRYLDPVSLAGLIVAIATLAWTIYTDQRDRKPEPPPASTIARQVRITLREQDINLPAGGERITKWSPPKSPARLARPGSHVTAARPASAHRRDAVPDMRPDELMPGVSTQMTRLLAVVSKTACRVGTV
jgi:hypothetical protein